MLSIRNATLGGLAALAIIGGAACSSKAEQLVGDATSSPSDSAAVATATPGTTSTGSTSSQPASTKTGATMSVAEVAEQAGPSVVRVETNGGVGSGFIASADGYILTNYHVIEGARPASIKVTLADGTVLPATVTGSDPKADLALLKVDATGLPALSIADLNDVEVGEDVVAIGYALDLDGGEGAGYSVTSGIVSAKNRAIEEDSLILGAIQTDAAVNHGNSGGPLLNMKGEVIGINTALAEDSSTGGAANGISMAVGADTIKAVYASLKATGQVNRGFLGVSNLNGLRPAAAKALGLDSNTTGVVLGTASSTTVAASGVVANGPAAKAGLVSGDVITKIGDTTISNESDLAVAMIQHQSGETVSVEYYHGSEKRTAQVTLATAPVQ
ncbi:hypothetical protein AYO38_05475 [bacterium SCGC AG-212-C10]|nr:hypothetical protein AYO38_05475 [bacterium SCGC AG-212-C10]